jgi:hypothetical protein
MEYQPNGESKKLKRGSDVIGFENDVRVLWRAATGKESIATKSNSHYADMIAKKVQSCSMSIGSTHS